MSESGVSSVVAQILLVAITVVLASILIVSLRPTPRTAYIVGVYAHRLNAESVEVTYVGGKDSPILDYLQVDVSQNQSHKLCEGNGLGAPDANPLIVGNKSICVCEGASPSLPIHVVVIGYFMDGGSQVVLEADV